MRLVLQDVARLFGVSESQVHRWVQSENLPVEVVNSRYRFSSCELLEWATLRGIDFSPEIFAEINGEHSHELRLTNALAAGGVIHLHGVRSTTSNVRSVLEQALDRMPLPTNVDRAQLVELLMVRESVGSTAVGDGIAIPHPRYPMVMGLAEPVCRLCFLSEPIEFSVPDRAPIDTLFILVCPTVHDHLQLLARLASVLRTPGFRELLRSKPSEDEVLRVVRDFEDSLQNVQVVA